MNITKCIEDTLVDRFAQLGFNYEKSEEGWTFTRETDGVEEFIEIEKSEWDNNMIYCEYRKGTSSRYSVNFLRDLTKREHVFIDESNLREELRLIVDITEKYALKWFEKIKVQKKIPVDNFLSEEWVPSIQAFISKHSIDLKNSQSISDLDKLLKQEVSKIEMYAISYCFGEIIKQNFAAEWEFSSDSEDGPIITNIAGRKNFYLQPYTLVRKTIIHPDDLSLVYFFTNIKSEVDDMKK